MNHCRSFSLSLHRSDFAELEGGFGALPISGENLSTLSYLRRNSQPGYARKSGSERISSNLSGCRGIVCNFSLCWRLCCFGAAFGDSSSTTRPSSGSSRIVRFTPTDDLHKAYGIRLMGYIPWHLALRPITLDFHPVADG